MLIVLLLYAQPCAFAAAATRLAAFYAAAVMLINTGSSDAMHKATLLTRRHTVWSLHIGQSIMQYSL
jgi:hypothetical protein